jgi:hypothetical protein
MDFFKVHYLVLCLSPYILTASNYQPSIQSLFADISFIFYPGSDYFQNSINDAFARWFEANKRASNFDKRYMKYATENMY